MSVLIAASGLAATFFSSSMLCSKLTSTSNGSLMTSVKNSVVVCNNMEEMDIFSRRKPLVIFCDASAARKMLHVMSISEKEVLDYWLVVVSCDTPQDLLTELKDNSTIPVLKVVNSFEKYVADEKECMNFLMEEEKAGMITFGREEVHNSLVNLLQPSQSLHVR